jgi:hypothetical protein
MAPWPGRIFVVSSLALWTYRQTSNFGSRSGYRSIDSHRSDTSVKSRLHALGSVDRFHAIFNLLISFTRYHTGLMMRSIHIDESTTRVSSAARPSRLCIPFSKKLDSLLDCLDNRRMMHSFRNSALEWVRGNQNDTHYCSHATFRCHTWILTKIECS